MNKTDRHNIIEILVKFAFDTINHKSSNRRKTIYLQTCLPKTSVTHDLLKHVISSIMKAFLDEGPESTFFSIALTNRS